MRNLYLIKTVTDNPNEITGGIYLLKSKNKKSAETRVKTMFTNTKEYNEKIESVERIYYNSDIKLKLLKPQIKIINES
jgi:hypothetical protein